MEIKIKLTDEQIQQVMTAVTQELLKGDTSTEKPKAEKKTVVPTTPDSQESDAKDVRAGGGRKQISEEDLDNLNAMMDEGVSMLRACRELDLNYNRIYELVGRKKKK